MNGSATSPVARISAVVLLVAALLGGQAVADASLPSSSRDTAGAPVERAGFAYLTGLRRFAAVLLFNRLDPQFHEYYRDVPVEKLKFLMPSFYLITWMDPQFVQPYYVSTWILYRSDRKDDAIALAQQSIENNPTSGLLRTSYAQLLYLEHRDVAEQVRQSDAVMSASTVWANPDEQWEAMKVISDIYAKAGYPDRAERALAVARMIDDDPTRVPGQYDDEPF